MREEMGRELFARVEEAEGGGTAIDGAREAPRRAGGCCCWSTEKFDSVGLGGTGLTLGCILA